MRACAPRAMWWLTPAVLRCTALRCVCAQIDGEWRFDSRVGALVWTIDLIDDTNRSGSMEFVVPVTDAEGFYPIDIEFASNKTFCDISVATVEHLQRGGAVKYSNRKVLATSDYQVV